MPVGGGLRPLDTELQHLQQFRCFPPADLVLVSVLLVGHGGTGQDSGFGTDVMQSSKPVLFCVP